MAVKRRQAGLITQRLDHPSDSWIVFYWVRSIAQIVVMTILMITGVVVRVVIVPIIVVSVVVVASVVVRVVVIAIVVISITIVRLLVLVVDQAAEGTDAGAYQRPFAHITAH